MDRLMSDASRMTFSGTDRYLRAAMSGLAARQRAIANNVANVDTPGFKATEVRFEDALKNAVARGNSSASIDQTSLNAAVSRTTPLDRTTSRADGNNVDIDREMELLGEANLNYSAMTQVMSTRLGILRNVINGR
jgi:flagellar basal-body rod protein FlgB